MPTTSPNNLPKPTAADLLMNGWDAIADLADATQTALNGKLGATTTAVNSDKLDGLDSRSFPRLPQGATGLRLDAGRRSGTTSGQGTLSFAFSTGVGFDAPPAVVATVEGSGGPALGVRVYGISTGGFNVQAFGIGGQLVDEGQPLEVTYVALGTAP